MTHSDFARLARAVYGDFSWRSAIAKAHTVNRSTVYRWSVGDAPIPDKVARSLEQEAAHKVARITKLIAA